MKKNEYVLKELFITKNIQERKDGFQKLMEIYFKTTLKQIAQPPLP